MKSMHRCALLVSVFAALCMTTGCVSSSSSRVTVQDSTKISKGQELSDLIRARDAGALTDSEYETVRRVILNRPN
jgi:hypothetical protein